MRRNDKAITDRAALDAIIRSSQVCHLALAKDNWPYLVPVSFGYDGRAIYLHTATEGTKLEFFQANPQVCFEFECNVEVRRHPDLACKWSMAYESVIGFGVIRELVEVAARDYALNEIMRQYSGRTWSFDPVIVARTRVWQIEINELTGKRSYTKTT
ncbi:MAG: pyridoxamine 5'-phosphate oxidase family protein [Verrucomicrobiota bacterium]